MTFIKELDRHQSVKDIYRFFAYEHLPEKLQAVSKIFCLAANDLLSAIPSDSSELTAGLRKLLEAKDCAVRASLPKE